MDSITLTCTMTLVEREFDIC